MAPVNQHAVVTALSTSVRSRDNQTILVESGGFTPAGWFLDRAQKATQGGDIITDEERPRKRRKLHPRQAEAGKKRAAAQLPALPANDEVVIWRTALDLHFPETLHALPATQEELQEDVNFQDAEPVLVVPHDIEDDRLRISTIGHFDGVLLVDTQDIPQEIGNALQRVAIPEQLTECYAGQREKSGSPATILRCTLKRSMGQLYTVLRLEATVSWKSGCSAFPKGLPEGKARVYGDYELLAEAYPDVGRGEVDHSAPWTPADFYDSVHVTDQGIATDGIFTNALNSELYPFQKRAVSWMLGREGVVEAGAMQAMKKLQTVRFYEEVRDVDGRPCCVNHLQAIITRDRPVEEHLSLAGGLLAEEMGLGKTVELMTLIRMNQMASDAEAGTNCNDGSGVTVSKSKATLIITPPAILEQWCSELARHAPALKVHVYNGIPTRTNKKYDKKQVIQDLAIKYDVVLATYTVLGREVHYAEDPPERDMRHERRFERKRSPLVQIKWWRICLDEVSLTAVLNSGKST
jgi:E3 ubiquitin-protein ligase SHPRH